MKQDLAQVYQILEEETIHHVVQMGTVIREVKSHKLCTGVSKRSETYLHCYCNDS